MIALSTKKSLEKVPHSEIGTLRNHKHKVRDRPHAAGQHGAAAILAQIVHIAGHFSLFSVLEGGGRGGDGRKGIAKNS